MIRRCWLRNVRSPSPPSPEKLGLIIFTDEALTKLLEDHGFAPRRTVVLAHGFDEEEVGARQGAGRIAPFLEARYGKDGALLLVDEGTGTVDGLWGGQWALPANAEKGYLDVKVGSLLFSRLEWVGKWADVW